MGVEVSAIDYTVLAQNAGLYHPRGISPINTIFIKLDKSEAGHNRQIERGLQKENPEFRGATHPNATLMHLALGFRSQQAHPEHFPE